ncbi:hypothetical protein ACN3E9_06795 [Vibrio pectenicida]|uniref:hypothetical protein n=1 Tax=Vibrio pectenicida TaxID=62763 RepID=UPI003B99D8C1
MRFAEFNYTYLPQGIRNPELLNIYHFAYRWPMNTSYTARMDSVVFANDEFEWSANNQLGPGASGSAIFNKQNQIAYGVVVAIDPNNPREGGGNTFSIIKEEIDAECGEVKKETLPGSSSHQAILPVAMAAHLLM